jgi:uncharacterized protein
MLKHLVLAFALLSPFASLANGQSNPTVINAVEAQKLAVEREISNNSGLNDLQQRMAQTAVARAVAERRAQLIRDTEKLVALTAELKEHVNKSGPNILSMDVVKKAAEIQKLAKSVEDKMKNAY